MTRPTTLSSRPGLTALIARIVASWVRSTSSRSSSRDVAGEERRVGVAVHAVDVGGDVDVDDVAVLDHRRVGDAVADHLVERGAARLREALVAQRRRVGAVVDHVLVRDAVELVGRDAGRDGLAGLGQAPAAIRLATRIFSMISGVCTHGSLPSRAVGLPDVLGTRDRLGHRQCRGLHPGRQRGANRHPASVTGHQASNTGPAAAAATDAVRYRDGQPTSAQPRSGGRCRRMCCPIR